MKIKIIALGKIKEKFLKDGIEEFLKRLTPYAPIEIIELPATEIKDAYLISKALEEEGRRILSLIKEHSYVVTLEINGKQFSSEDFSDNIKTLINNGINELVFVIGSSYGLSKEFSERADLRMSLSKMTFLHQFTRLILVEQIYRAFKIMRGETYHK